ncbi:MAG TPA: TonB-dependent receptor [Sunxiuqinia sp.]|nr:TonB-dependent receptor [Sunxiuqinia sp.]
MFLIAQILMVSPAYSQTGKQIALSGTITDQNGEPLVGVNIVVKGTTRGTITDVDGHYSISLNSTDTLQVSFIGYTMQTVPVKARSLIDVKLHEDTTDLGEVVVVGYGEVKRANLLGSVSSISAKEIEDIPATNLTDLLDGRLAGVSVSPAQPTGNPGASTRVKIRATTTFGSSGGGAKDPAPLYIVDGFEVTQEEYDVLDPSEIESFSVLKDASAAVYGSKGANGVVLVKTKRGREGKLRISYSGSVGISDATQQTSMLSSYDLARMLNARYIGYDAKYDTIQPAEMDAMKNLNYNWLDQAWQTAVVTRHTINITGGSDKVQYFAGGSYVYNAGNFPKMGVGKYSYRLGLDADITDDLKASITVALDSRDFKRPYLNAVGSNTMEGLFQQLLQAPKWTPAFVNGLPVHNNLEYNPLELFNSDSYRDDVDKGNTLNLKLSYSFPKVKGLVASATYSRRESNGYYKQYSVPYNLYTFDPKPGFTYVLSNNLAQTDEISNTNRISESYRFSQRYQLNLNLNYNRKFGKHSVAAFLTYEQSEGKSHDFGAVAENMQLAGVETQMAFDYLAARSSGGLNESGDLGAVFRFNYGYADKYLLESTMRYESTTLFAPGERSGLFPSVSVGWVMSQENFMKDNLNFLNFLKLRYSIGLTGYSSVGAYEYTLQYGPSGSYLFGGGAAAGGIGVSGPTDVVSSGVSWEKSRMQNLGLDMKFFDSRLSVSIDGFYTYQYDILDQRTVNFPETSGITKMPSENLGRLEAWGYDMSIGYNGKVGNDFRWHVSGNFSFATNRILERPTQYGPNDFRYPIGQSTSAAGREQGFITKGIIRTQEQLDAINAQWMAKWGHVYTINNKPAQVGSLFYQDIGRPGNIAAGEPSTVFEPDGNIDMNSRTDMKYVERVNDHFVWQNLLPNNVSLGFTWKDVKVSTLFGMAYGTTNKVVDKLARTVPSVNNSTKLVLSSPAFWSDFWTPDNPNAAYPTVAGDNAGYDKEVSTFWMKNVYQLRMKNLNISYDVPKSFSNKLHIPQLRVYFVGTNLWSPISTFKYKEDAIARYNTYPLLRTFSFGVNLKM